MQRVRVGVEDEGDVGVVVCGAVEHPLDGAFEALPVGLAVVEGEEGCDAEAGLGLVVGQ